MNSSLYDRFQPPTSKELDAMFFDDERFEREYDAIEIQAYFEDYLAGRDSITDFLCHIEACARNLNARLNLEVV